MADLLFDQVNIVVPDLLGATKFLRAIGAEVPEVGHEWEEWSPHHVGLPTAAKGFDADLDSPAYASHWGGLPDDFIGVVINLRAEDRGAVDETFERATALGAKALRRPHDAFWGARYAVVRGPGPIVLGLMSPTDPAFRTQPPAVSDFA